MARLRAPRRLTPRSRSRSMTVLRRAFFATTEKVLIALRVVGPIEVSTFWGGVVGFWVAGSWIGQPDRTRFQTQGEPG